MKLQFHRTGTFFYCEILTYSVSCRQGNLNNLYETKCSAGDHRVATHSSYYSHSQKCKIFWQTTREQSFEWLSGWSVTRVLNHLENVTTKSAAAAGVAFKELMMTSATCVIKWRTHRVIHIVRPLYVKFIIWIRCSNRSMEVLLPCLFRKLWKTDRPTNRPSRPTWRFTEKLRPQESVQQTGMAVIRDHAAGVTGRTLDVSQGGSETVLIFVMVHFLMLTLY